MGGETCFALHAVSHRNTLHTFDPGYLFWHLSIVVDERDGSIPLFWVMNLVNVFARVKDVTLTQPQYHSSFSFHG